MNKTTDFAYAAGYIDGDGCFFIGSIKISPFFQDTFTIITTHLENAEWFHKHFKGNIHIKSLNQKNRKISYHFVFTKQGYEDLKNIYPFLVEKRLECLTFLQFRDLEFKDQRKKLINQMYDLKNISNLIPISIKESVESIRNTITPSQEDFAYLAGFIDAECSLDIQKRMQKRGTNPNYRMQIQCNNTKAPCFFWLSQRFGGQFHFLDKSKIQNARNQMCWRLSDSSLTPLLNGVYPFLKYKKPICKQLIEFSKQIYIRKGSPSPNSPQYADFYRPILETREKIYHIVRSLNNPSI
jgi:hypothetical protein